MTKKIFTLLLILATTTGLFAQTPAAQPAQPLLTRQISGIVLDSTEQSIRGANVTLTSQTDTLKTATNEDGLFFFKDVKAWEFTLSVSSLGYISYVKLGRYNFANPRLTMDPIILRTSAQLLKEVTIKGAPSITYKTDTVEYRATDYIVREGAGVDQLLKKMEGMDVSKDGSLTYNGEPVDKARLNGKDFMGGSVASTIKMLPAEIVEKIQIIDDYGDQAARTGIKDTDPKKLLNITTKEDRSLGYIARVGGGAGNDARYEGNLSGTRINANRNYTLSANLNNTVNGVASGMIGGGEGPSGPPGSGTPGGSGGNTKRQSVGFTYRDQLSPKVQVNMNYSFSLTNVNALNSSISQDFSTKGTMFSINESNNDNNSKEHRFKMDLENNLDSANFLKITPDLSYTSSFDDNRSSSILSGLIRQNQTGLNSSVGQTPNYGLTVFYHRLFPKRGRNYSIQLSGSNRNNEQDREQNTNIVYFDQVTNALLKDSLVHRSTGRDNLTTNYRANLTFSEPLSVASTISFTGLLNYNGYDNKAITSNLSPGGAASIVDSLSNIFKYSFTQARLSFNYNYQQNKYSVSFGFTGVPSVLAGTSESLGTSVHRNSFNIIPVMRFQYVWSTVQKFTLNYTGASLEPAFDQLQPVRDVSNPQNPVIGNPDLKVSFNHSINAFYGNYFPNSRFSINATLGTTLYDDRVITNVVQVTDSYNSLKYERHFLNVNGTYSANGNYTITKQLANRKYNFTLSGNLIHQHNAGMSNNIRNSSKQWTFTQRLSLRMNPSERFDINPSVSYAYSKSDNSLPSAIDSRTNITSLSMDGTWYFLKMWPVGYSVSKSFVRGINTNFTSNPLIVNASFGKDFLTRRSLTVRLQAFDLFNQNKFINRSITETSIIDTKSNSLSRYFMISLNANLQRWQGTPTRNNKTMKRKGDGSFIPN